MKVQAHFLAENANFNADGTFTVFKGGITDLNASEWPAFSRFAMITRLELSHEEASQLVELAIRISFEGQEISVVRQPLAVKAIDPEKPHYVNSIVELGIPLPGPGKMTIEASVNDRGLPLLYLWAQQLGTSHG